MCHWFVFHWYDGFITGIQHKKMTLEQIGCFLTFSCSVIETFWLLVAARMYFRQDRILASMIITSACVWVIKRRLCTISAQVPNIWIFTIWHVSYFCSSMRNGPGSQHEVWTLIINVYGSYQRLTACRKAVNKQRCLPYCNCHFAHLYCAIGAPC